MKLTEKELDLIADDLLIYMKAFQGYEKLVGFSSDLNTFKLQKDHFDSVYQTCKPTWFGKQTLSLCPTGQTEGLTLTNPTTQEFNYEED